MTEKGEKVREGEESGGKIVNMHLLKACRLGVKARKN
jgi:hypothetical protein